MNNENISQSIGSLRASIKTNSQLEMAYRAMEESLVECLGYIDRMSQEGVRSRAQTALAKYRALKQTTDTKPPTP